MKFAAIIEYTADTQKVADIRPAHREYLKSLLEKNKLFATGPFTDDSGALIIYEADSPEEAETLLQGDPFHRGGVFVSWRLRPWKTVLANKNLFPE